MLLLARTRGLRRKQFSICSKHIICLHCYYECSGVFTTRFNTCCQNGPQPSPPTHSWPFDAWKHPCENSIIPQQRWTVMWSETVGLRTRPVWDQKKIGLGLGLPRCGLGLAGLVLCFETRSCHSRRHNDLEGHSNFSSTI